MSAADLFILYRDTPDGPELSMGKTSNRPGVARTFVRGAQALNYAYKHGAKVVHLSIPAGGGLPTVVAVIDPKALG